MTLGARLQPQGAFLLEGLQSEVLAVLDRVHVVRPHLVVMLQRLALGGVVGAGGNGGAGALAGALARNYGTCASTRVGTCVSTLAHNYGGYCYSY